MLRQKKVALPLHKEVYNSFRGVIQLFTETPFVMLQSAYKPYTEVYDNYRNIVGVSVSNNWYDYKMIYVQWLI